MADDHYKWTFRLAANPAVLVIHVFPAGDSDRHDKDENCRCKPRLDLSNPGALVYDHNLLPEDK